MTEATDAKSPGRILVVDDHRAAREGVIFVLREAGHAVQGAASAVEGLAILDRQAFDVVITDLQMPGIDGLEFIRQLSKRHGHCPRHDRLGG
jgi:CheY-like chemotaxis protein